MKSPRFPGLIELLLINARRDPAVVARAADRRLVQLVRHAAENIPFYRETWRAAGFDARDFHSRADLAQLPIVDKEMIVGAGDAARDPRVRTERLQTMRTSGTSGRAITLSRNPREMRAVRRAILRQVLQIGLRPKHRVLTLGSMWLRDRRGIVVRAITRTRFIEPLVPVEEQVRALHEYRPVALMGQTGGIYLLARELLRRGEPYPLRWVVPTGATLVPHMRQTMFEAFGTQPLDLYGAIELGPVSWQCRQREYHIDADRIIVEIVDADGRPLPPGTPGQVVCTSLLGWTMPLIRYRLRDVSCLATRTCTCGCRFPIMEQVHGRVNDFIPTPAGDLVSPHFFFHIFDGVERNPVKDWRVVQEDRARLRFEYVPEAWCTPAAIAQGQAKIETRFGATCHVTMHAVADIPLTPAGKQRCIVSNLRPAETDWLDAWAETRQVAQTAGELVGAQS